MIITDGHIYKHEDEVCLLCGDKVVPSTGIICPNRLSDKQLHDFMEASPDEYILFIWHRKTSEKPWHHHLHLSTDIGEEYTGFIIYTEYNVDNITIKLNKQ